MSEFRSFDKSIIENDEFVSIPLSSQALYFHLNMAADDKGVVYCPKAVAKSIEALQTDYQILLDHNFIMENEHGGIKITHWKEHNGVGYVKKKRLNYSYRKWRKKVLERDNYKCQKCGSTEKLHAHHIKSFSEFPDEREIVENGITLCESCHRKLHGLEKRR